MAYECDDFCMLWQAFQVQHLQVRIGVVRIGAEGEMMPRQSGKTYMMENFEQLRRIWTEKGTHPDYHQAQQQRLKNEWPLLYEWMVKNFGEPK